MGRKSRGANDEGVPVWEALERLAPKELCERYKEIAGYLQYQACFVEPGVPIDPTYDEVRDLDSRLSEILTSRLETGEFIASGIGSPVRNIANPRQDIARELWAFLRLDLIESEASGHGLKLVVVRIRGLPNTEPPPSASEPPHIGSSMGAQDQPGRQRRGGPRTIMPLVQAEMAARAARGELLPTLAAESRFLEKWAKAHHPEFARPPRAKSIGEALRSMYKDLKEGGDSGN